MIFIFYIYSKTRTLSTKRVPLFFDFTPLLPYCSFAVVKFVLKTLLRLIHVSVETNRTQCFCTANSKDTICPLVRPRF